MGKGIKVIKSAIVSYNETVLSYIKEIKSYPKLTKEEEIELFKQNTRFSRNKIINAN